MKARRQTRAVEATTRRGTFGLVQLEKLERRDCPAMVLAIDLPAATTYEGDTVVFTARLSEPSSRPERVAITVASGTATLGQDFMFPNSTQLLFAPGQTTKTFSVRTFRDTISEGTESFVITAQSLSRPSIQAVSRTATINELVPRILQADSVSVTEGDSGTKTATFTVRLDIHPTLPVTVSYATADVTATAGSDYVATSGLLTFAPGETTKAVSVTVNGDVDLESDETFRLNFFNPSRGTTIVTPFVTGTIVNDETDQPGFQITVEYVTSFYGEVPVSVRNATQQAVQRWQQVITGDVPSYFEVSTGRYVDDFRMRVQMGLLGSGSDGGGGALANAGPTQYRTGGAGLPWLGDTGIDPADVTNPQLVAILMHEIGHALGFAPGNAIFDRWVTGITWTGPNAVREYGAIAGTTMTSVPLETGGGGGTAGAHWSEATFGTELMTGYAEAAGVAMPLSRLTVGAFADLGYTVNYAAADMYSLSPIRAPVTISPVVPVPPPSTAAGSRPTSPTGITPPAAPTNPPTAPKADNGSSADNRGGTTLPPRRAAPRAPAKPAGASVRAPAFAALGRR